MSGGGGGGSYGGLKDYGVEGPRAVTYGVWAEGFADHERRNDVPETDGATTDRQDIRSTTVGVMSGIDHTYMRSGREGVMIGALGGYSHTNIDFSGNATLTAPKKQDIDAGIVGLYGSYFYGGVAMDILAKADIFDLDQRTGGCGTANGSTDGASYTLAGNIYHRRDYGS